jgi:class 3 adenylate cyclase
MGHGEAAPPVLPVLSEGDGSTSEGTPSARSEVSGLALPPRLEHYLPPDLWRRLTAEVPRRGVLLNALDRLRSILYLLSTYLPRHLVEEKMRRPVPGLVQGKMLCGSLLFADVSGFTALSERLALLDSERIGGLALLGPKGAERLTDLMNQYFDRMIEILTWSGGILLKFAGDALLVYFPEQKEGEQARWAVRAGQRMMRAMADFSALEALPRGQRGRPAKPHGGPAQAETVNLQMKIGIGTGGFLAASVGSVERTEYVIMGETVGRTMAAEGIAEAGQVVADMATVTYLDHAYCAEYVASPAPPDALGAQQEEHGRRDGFYRVRCESDQELGDFEIKSERRRARGAIPFSAQSDAIVGQMENTFNQIEALAPYLAAELVDHIVARAQQRRTESEYRPTTVLFLNVIGLEELLSFFGGCPDALRAQQGERKQEERRREENGVRQVTRLLDDYFQAMHQVIARYGGVVSRIDPYRQGSKMLVLFGAPLAPEDSPQRAVSAALAMNDELAACNARWQRQLSRSLPPDRSGPLLQQRIGITQGDTFAGQVGTATRREYTVMGDDVNLAARLMAAAQPGQILISQRVYDAVVDHIAAMALPAVQVKGKRWPIPIYQPTGPRDDPLARRLRRRGPLLGRDAELKRGLALLRQTLAGQGTVLTIAGPAGIGKSHLADELAARALARGAKLLFTSCQSYLSNAPYAPWITLLQALMGITAADDPEARRAKLLRCLADWELPAQEYTGPLCDLMGLQAAHPAMIPLASAQAHRTAAQAGTLSRPALFAQLEQKVADQEQKGLDLWRLVQERPSAHTQDRPFADRGRAQPGKTWQTLQTRVAARRQERLFVAVEDLLARLAADTPLVLTFESAQWMDPASQTLVNDLHGWLQREERVPILLLLLQRSEGIGEEDTAPGPEETLTLGPLSQEGTTALLQHLLAAWPERRQGTAGRGEGTAANDPAELEALAHAIHQQSGGNPLFVEEIVRWLQRSGNTPLEGLKGGIQASVTLQELALSHLDSLPHGQRDVARCASIVGIEFPRGAVRALLPSSTTDTTLAADLSGLESTGLILLTETGADDQYAFRQTLVREVIYNSQSFARRRELHARIAAYVEGCHADDLEHQAELLAYHYESAASPLPAARYLVLSGHKARQRYAYPQAADYYGRALAALDLLSPGEANAEVIKWKAQAHEGLGDVAVLTGGLAAAATAFDAARACQAYQSGIQIPARLLLKLAQVLPTQDRADEAMAFAQQAWSMQGTRAGLPAAATLAWILWRAGDGRAGDWIEQAKGAELAAQGALGADPWAAGIAALLTDLAGDWASAQRAYLTLDHPTGAALAACRLGDRHLQQGDLERALNLYDQAAEIWKREDDLAGLALARYRQAEACWQQGNPCAARAALQEASSLLETALSAGEDDRQTVQQAFAVAEADRPAVRLACPECGQEDASGVGQRAWPPWRWRRYDDAFRILLLFRP